MRAFSVCCLLLLSNFASAEDYPTQETVEMVIFCMTDIGAQSEENLYACACRHDVIKGKMTFKEYESASLFERYSNMPGKKGQMVRDNKNGERMLDKLKEVRKEAIAQCPLVKHIARDPPSK